MWHQPTKPTNSHGNVDALCVWVHQALISLLRLLCRNGLFQRLRLAFQRMLVIHTHTRKTQMHLYESQATFMWRQQERSEAPHTKKLLFSFFFFRSFLSVAVAFFLLCLQHHGAFFFCSFCSRSIWTPFASVLLDAFVSLVGWRKKSEQRFTEHRHQQQQAATHKK